MTSTQKKLGRWQGAGLLTTTLLGTSVFILPQMTVDIAGSSALWAWLLLTITIIPVALVFGRLSGLFPHAAGPAYFVEQAFGKISGRTIGLIFLFAVPLGGPAAIIMTFEFINSLVALTPNQQLAGQLCHLAVLFLLNYRGIQISATLQFTLAFIIIAVLVAMLTSGFTQQEITASDIEYAVNGSVMFAAAGLAFWSFLGIEAMSHLASDFKNPKRDLLPAILIGTLLVGLVYLVCTLLVLAIPTNTPLSMVGIFNQLLGSGGTVIIGILGVAGGIATTNVYTAGTSRLACSFAKDGVMPKYLAKENKHGVSVTSLSTLLGIMAIVLIVSHVQKYDLEDLVAWVNGVFVIIYFASMMAAIKLLKKKYRPLIAASCIFCFMLMYGLGYQMLYAFCLIAIVAPILALQHKQQLKRQLIR